MKILITGSDGFLGKNLSSHLSERKDYEVLTFTRRNHTSELSILCRDADFIFHLAGINRPENPGEFWSGNLGLTSALCLAISASGRKIPVIYASSIQATLDNEYGNSKREAENILFNLQAKSGVPIYIFRLENIFGKWCRPNYNSVVANFCYNIARDQPIKVDNPNTVLNLVYVDDVVKQFIDILQSSEYKGSNKYLSIATRYSITVGELADRITEFKSGRKTLIVNDVGVGVGRALYSTFISYLPVEEFSYPVPKYTDTRGSFVEMIKTPSSGQLSYFTAAPGVTRGGHYHHSKSEKFLVISGFALFRFQQISTGEMLELEISGQDPRIVDSIPGWAHDVKNIGNEDLVVMLWANEVFDRARPDTLSYLMKGKM
jgi:UDP-2-acetamido-2,6-beta-L-arabino-hexul-4-ose reductase